MYKPFKEASSLKENTLYQVPRKNVTTSFTPSMGYGCEGQYQDAKTKEPFDASILLRPGEFFYITKIDQHLLWVFSYRVCDLGMIFINREGSSKDLIDFWLEEITT